MHIDFMFDAYEMEFPFTIDWRYLMEMNFTKIIKYANDELFSNGNLSIIDEVFSPKYIVHSGGKDHQGHKFIKQFANMLITAVSDIEVVDVEILLQAGDLVAWQRTLTGKHIANMMGALPSGQKLIWRDMIVSRFENGRIAEEWNVSELAGEMLSKPPQD